MDGPLTSTELHGLTSSTEYLLSVFPVYEAGVGEGLRGLVTTGGWGSWLFRGSAPIPGEGPLPPGSARASLTLSVIF